METIYSGGPLLKFLVPAITYSLFVRYIFRLLEGNEWSLFPIREENIVKGPAISKLAKRVML